MASEAAQVGSRIVEAAFRRDRRSGQPEELESKGAGDYVTAIDRESEAAVRAFLGEATPDVPILGEESGGSQAERFWAVDPLDGTTNFVIGFPAVSVSVALVAEGVPVVAAVRAPMLDLDFRAFQGGGSWSNGAPLHVSRRPPRQAIVATALPFRRKELMARYLPVLEQVFAAAEDIRRAGSAALELAWVASGVWDGYFELNLKVWDVAAGALLVREAGGLVSDWDGGPGFLSGDVIAGSPDTHAMLLASVARAGPDAPGG